MRRQLSVLSSQQLALSMHLKSISICLMLGWLLSAGLAAPPLFTQAKEHCSGFMTAENLSPLLFFF